MKKLYLTLIFLFIFSAGFSDGGFGKYFIKGKAFGSNDKVLANALILMDFQDQIKEIKTDEAGNFKLEINWATACRTGETIADIEKMNASFNPTFIHLSYNGKKIKIENQWRKYALISPRTESNLTQNLDLHFQ
ncbi:MAG TPA: hypothetical protein VK927_10440 [Adhaeribacter sp.]|nr:hypothetical protein [Adhaeribacter sp.]